MNKLIRKAMVDANIKSVAELSRLSGVPYVTINHIMQGNDTKVSTVTKLFDCMNFKLEYVNK
jgi:predicted transcriptional regulator|tara:strand:+ start:81 stop:266 length:186 start_codon:yes stop_codon:yes gene_type:complete